MGLERGVLSTKETEQKCPQERGHGVPMVWDVGVHCRGARSAPMAPQSLGPRTHSHQGPADT